MIIGHVYNLNLDTRQLTISWVLGGCGNYTLPSFAGHYGRSFTTCAPPDRAVDVYFDRLLKVVLRVGGISDATFHLGIKVPSFLMTPLCFQ